MNRTDRLVAMVLFLQGRRVVRASELAEHFEITERTVYRDISALDMDTTTLLKIRFLSSDQVITDAQSFYARWPELDLDAKRQVVETIVEKITIGKDDVAIDLCYLPSSPENTTKRQRNFMDSSPPPA